MCLYMLLQVYVTVYRCVLYICCYRSMLQCIGMCLVYVCYRSMLQCLGMCLDMLLQVYAKVYRYVFGYVVSGLCFSV